MKTLITKKRIGLIAILTIFIGSEIILDYWLNMQSITVKCWFVILVISIYYVILGQFFKDNKPSQK